MHRNLNGLSRSQGGVRWTPRVIHLRVVSACWLAILLCGPDLHAANRSQPEAGGPRRTALAQLDGGVTSDPAVPSRELLDRYCVVCHNERVVQGRGGVASPLTAQLRSIGLTLDTLDLSNVGRDAETWETVVRKLRAGAMPPAGRPRPDAQMRNAFLTRLEADLDAAWAVRADLPRTAVFHRLNRAEYANVIRDLLALDVDTERLDEGSPLVREPSRSGEMYPHVYGPINPDAVVRVRSLVPDSTAESGFALISEE